ncbi:MAG: hypothetical protein WBG86_18790 [Polyangiales bacterium]
MEPPHRARREETPGRWLLVVAASVLVHGSVLSLVATLPSSTTPPRLRAIDVTFTVVPPEPPATTVSSSAPKVDHETPTPKTASRRTNRRRSRSIRRADRPNAVEIIAPRDPVVVSNPTLDPTNAARAFVVSQEPLPSREAGQGDATTARVDPFEGVGRKRYLSTREPPSLRPHSDGTYRYKGRSFKAIVERDGSVTFDDGYRQGMTLNFDITDHMMRKRGEDPYRVEKNWFLEGTEEFRKELFERWRTKQNRIALQKLRGRLLRISEDSLLTDAQKEARVVAMFRDTADDDAGAAARKTIADFVERKMPATVLPRVAN